MRETDNEISILKKEYGEINDKIVKLKENLTSKEGLKTEKNRIVKEIKLVEQMQKVLSNTISQFPVLKQQSDGIDSQINNLTPLTTVTSTLLDIRDKLEYLNNQYSSLSNDLRGIKTRLDIFWRK